MGLRENENDLMNDPNLWYENQGKKRCVYADSWFASVETQLALKKELGCHFTGPIKTAHKYYPIDELKMGFESYEERTTFGFKMQ